MADDCDLSFGGYLPPATVPPDPTGENWRGEPGPPGPAGPAATALGVAYSASGAGPGDYLVASGLTSCLVLQLLATAAISAGDLNYTLELWDGSPGSGVLLYQATGITDATYTDRASFYAAITSGSLYARATAIDIATYTGLTVSAIVLAVNV